MECLKSITQEIMTVDATGGIMTGITADGIMTEIMANGIEAEAEMTMVVEGMTEVAVVIGGMEEADINTHNENRKGATYSQCTHPFLF